jgi:hypothetical protein
MFCPGPPVTSELCAFDTALEDRKRIEEQNARMQPTRLPDSTRPPSRAWLEQLPLAPYWDKVPRNLQARLAVATPSARTSLSLKWE